MASPAFSSRIRLISKKFASASRGFSTTAVKKALGPEVRYVYRDGKKEHAVLVDPSWKDCNPMNWDWTLMSLITRGEIIWAFFFYKVWTETGHTLGIAPIHAANWTDEELGIPTD